MKKRIGIIGAGSAGILTASYFLCSLDNNYEIVSIYDPNTPILGIGESTNPGFVRVLEYAMRYSIYEDTESLDSTLKFGTKFINWREKDWLNPLIASGGIAVHFNNFKLKEFAFSRFQKLWSDKFSIIEGCVNNMEDTLDGVTLTIDNKEERFDYVVDCSGFPKDYSDYTYSTCSLLNHALIHSEEFDPIEYTEHIATKHGWIFGVPLTSRKTYGYMFNDTITTIEDARQDFADTLKIPVEKLQSKEYSFRPYYANKIVNNNILLNGNRALFFEPISATSINQYNATCAILLDYITEKISENQANARWLREVQTTEDIINWIYHGGTNFNSEFWNKAVANSKANLKNNKRFNDILDANQAATSAGAPYAGPAHLFTTFSLVVMDESFGYNYFKGAPRQFDV